MLLDIAGISIDLTGTNEYFINRSKEFEISDSHGKQDFKFVIETTDFIPFPEGDVIVYDKVIWKIGPDKSYNICVTSPDQKRLMALMKASEDWSNVKITSIKSENVLTDEGKAPIKWNDYYSFYLAGIAFRNRLIRMNGILIHCSSISYKGHGLIFSAPSGTGKSTHTRLWKEIYGKDVNYINDDRPAIRFINDIPMVCGSPWSGTSDLFSNRKEPLIAIVMLERSDSNSIERLQLDKALQLLMPRCFLPYFDQKMMIEAMDTLEQIVKSIPVYLLKCRPDYEAVEIVLKCLRLNV